MCGPDSDRLHVVTALFLGKWPLGVV
jgi:hypothetical protein